MFPRIKRYQKNGATYEYLVISESIYKEGKGSYTKDIANLGNIKTFKTKDINNLLDGLIRIFKLEKYTSADGIEMIASLEYGNIIFWQKIWNKLELSKLIKRQIKLKNKRIEIEVEKYIEIMTVNRCVEPFSKLGVTRWLETTCYKEMKGYKDLSLEVTLFYRSMDYLLSIKEELERVMYDKLRNLFSINVKMTFYDITSTYFYSDSCPLSANGYSRDSRPDKVQIIVGVVTSYEGYPIKHYVFEGNTKDETTVIEVLKDLKKEYNIEETTFVGDRGMITKLNIEKIIKEGYDYIMEVKTYQDELCQMLLTEDELRKEDFEDYNSLKIKEIKVLVKYFMKLKIREILKKEKVKVVDKQLMSLEERIDNLRKKDKALYKDFKIILNEISEEIDIKICRKLFQVIKKYEGRYEDKLRYIVCLNEERKEASCKKREEYILRLSKELDKLFSEETKERDIVELEKALNKVFEGYKGKYKKYYQILRDKESKKAVGYKLNKEQIEHAKKLDGIFVLVTSRGDLEKTKVVESYKNLQEVEILFDDFKNFVDVRPVRHWLENRVRAHVFICILSLLLKRIFEINYHKGKALTEPLEAISKSKLIKYEIKFSEKEERSKIFHKVTNTSPLQKKYFKLVGIISPENLQKYLWC